MQINQDLLNSELFYSKVIIRPLYGKVKEVKLNRTSYEISSCSSDEFNYTGTDIRLPCFKNEHFSFSLRLIQSFKAPHYILESKTDKSFRLNGNLVYKAVLSQGDKLDIGHNRFEFSYLNHAEVSGTSLSDEIIKSDLPILIEGETGVGKSFMAKKIHEGSGRLGNFIHINLSSFSKGLIESELFGHVKGAFTGAVYEIDSLSIELQTKLLLFLDSKSFRKVGGTHESKVNVRIIFASGRSLRDLVKENYFRKDMYYRITMGETVKIHPLRKDPKRIKEIISQFELEQDCVLTIRLEKFYLSLSWPGNIRQLWGHLERKKVLSKGRKLDLDKSDDLLIEDAFNINKNGISFMKYRDLKVGYFSNVLSKMNGDVHLAAETLDVSVNTVKNVLKKVA